MSKMLGLLVLSSLFSFYANAGGFHPYEGMRVHAALPTEAQLNQVDDGSSAQMVMQAYGQAGIEAVNYMKARKTLTDRVILKSCNTDFIGTRDPIKIDFEVYGTSDGVKALVKEAGVTSIRENGVMTDPVPVRSVDEIENALYITENVTKQTPVASRAEIIIGAAMKHPSALSEAAKSALREKLVSVRIFDLTNWEEPMAVSKQEVIIEALDSGGSEIISFYASTVWIGECIK